MDWVSTSERFTDTADESKDGFSFKREFIVVMSGTQEPTDPLKAVQAPQIPVIGEPHPAGLGVSVQSKTASHLSDSPTGFLVSVSYGKNSSATDNNGDGGGGDESGLKPTLSLRTERVIEATNRDAFWNPITNSNGIPIANPFEFERERLILGITARVPFPAIQAVDWDLARGLVHGPLWNREFLQQNAAGIEDQAIRKAGGFAKFLGVFPAFRVKFVDFGSRTTQERTPSGGEDTVWDINLSFSVDFWLGAVLDEGFYRGPGTGISPGQLGNVDPEDLRRILDLNGIPVTRPQLLNGKGEPLPKGDAPFFLVFQIHNHANLNLDILRRVGLPETVKGYRFKDER